MNTNSRLQIKSETAHISSNPIRGEGTSVLLTMIEGSINDVESKEEEHKEQITDICWIIDNSGSMLNKVDQFSTSVDEKNRIDVVKEACINLLDLFGVYYSKGHKISLSIVIFSSTAQQILVRKIITPESIPAVVDIINSMVAYGGTDITQGLIQWHNIFRQIKSDASDRDIFSFLLSDGYSNIGTMSTDINLVVDIAISIGNDTDESLLQSTSKLHDCATNPQELVDQIHGYAWEKTSNIAEDFTISIPEHFRVESLLGDTDDTNQIRCTEELIPGQHIMLILYPKLLEVTLVHAYYTDPNTGTKCKISVMLIPPIEPNVFQGNAIEHLIRGPKELTQIAESLSLCTGTEAENQKNIETTKKIISDLNRRNNAFLDSLELGNTDLFMHYFLDFKRRIKRIRTKLGEANGYLAALDLKNVSLQAIQTVRGISTSRMPSLLRSKSDFQSMSNTNNHLKTIRSQSSGGKPKPDNYMKAREPLALPTLTRRPASDATKKNATYETTEVCVGCLQNKHFVVFRPCNHLTMCQDCANKLIALPVANATSFATSRTPCPMCRVPIDSIEELSIIGINCSDCGLYKAKTYFEPCMHLTCCEDCATLRIGQTCPVKNCTYTVREIVTTLF